ncbi:hypothetical protein BH20GEM2_BH20GEM2_20410 [soil metagenome]
MEAASARDLFREVEAVLMRRVEHVERENRRLKRLGLVMAAGLAVALLVSLGLLMVGLSNGFPGSGAAVINARSFILRDDAGLARATLELTDEGQVRMGMRDRDGRERVRLGLLQDGSPGLTLSDREGRPRVVLGVLPDQTTNLVFADEAGRSRAVLGLTQDQAATLVFADRGGETRVGVGVDSQGQGGVTLYEQEAGPRPAEAVPDSVPEVAADSVVPPEP